MLHYMHYRVGKRLQHKEEKQTAAKKSAEDYGEVHRDYSCVGIEHQGTDLLSPGIPRSVIEVGEYMITEKEQGCGKDVFQISGVESVAISVAQHAG